MVPLAYNSCVSGTVESNSSSDTEKERAGFALGWTSDLFANHPWALQRNLLLRSIWKEKSRDLMHKDTKKRDESIRGCGLSLFKNPRNTCYHIYSIRHCACNVHIFSEDIFQWCSFTRKSQWRKLRKKNPRRNREILTKIWKEGGSVPGMTVWLKLLLQLFGMFLTTLNLDKEQRPSIPLQASPLWECFWVCEKRLLPR